MKPLILLAAALISAPALAQSVPQPPTTAVPSAKPERPPHRGLFGNMSAEGRATMMEAFRASRGDPKAIRNAREKISALLAADKLDVNALRRAMDEERALVSQSHVARQEATLKAVQKLSDADRKAFAQYGRMAQRQVDNKAPHWRKQAGEGQKRAERPATAAQ